MNIEKITIVLENCECCHFEKQDILKFELKEFKNTIVRTNKSNEVFHKQRAKTKARIILRKNEESLRLRNDVAQIHLSYSNGMKESFYLSWGEGDNLMDCSSLQKIKIGTDTISWFNN